MKRFNHRIILLLIGTFAFSFSTEAQQFKPNTEVGILLGTSYYLGDLNTTHFNQPLPAVGLIIRKNIDKRFAYKAEVMYLNIQSDERYSEDTIAKNRGLHFRSPIYELSGQVEFNFLPYQPGNPLYTWTPYVYSGISIFHFNPQAENKNGEWVNLQELGTEGQGTTLFPEKEKYSLIQYSIAMGGGFKIAVNPSFNIILEYGVRKTFTDYLDDVSTTFVGGVGNPYPLDMSQEALAMSDPESTHTRGDQRGDPDKKDWYSFAGITLSFTLNNNTKGCDY
ncbi:MAG: hypothetical protein H8D33_05580 [Cryomorphaceae bacterium]|nr:hypothetical protein [Cryomorphaceae bacterium]